MISKEEVLDMNLTQIKTYLDKNPEDELFITDVLNQIVSGCKLNKIKTKIKGEKIDE